MNAVEPTTNGATARALSVVKAEDPLEPSGRVPPHDLIAEAAVISAALLDPAALPKVRGAGLEAALFFDEKHRRIYEAACVVADEGRPVDLVSVHAKLHDMGRLPQVGAGYLAEVADATPAHGNVETHAEIVREKATLRGELLTMQRVAARIYGGAAAAGDAHKALEGLGAASQRARGIVTYGTEEIARALPPPSFLIEGLRFGRGAPLLFAGPSFIGKTVVAQSIIMSLCTGQPLWGVYKCGVTPCLHIDLEQGREITNRRYQRIARAVGVDIRDVGEGLHVAIKPSIRLDSKNAEDAYARVFDGHGFVLIDCLRAAAPSADENSSEVRRYIDLLDRVAEKTGATVAIIHHTKKPSKDTPDGARHGIRGSSAIFDACGGVYVLTGDKGQPARVHHEKERTSGLLVDDFGLRVEDVEIDGDKRAGLRVVHMEPEELDAAESHDPKTERDLDRLRAHFRAKPVQEGNRKALRAAVGMKGEAFSAALSVLMAQGEVVEEKDGPRFRWQGGSK